MDINLFGTEYCKWIRKTVTKTKTGCTQGECKNCPYKVKRRNAK